MIITVGHVKGGVGKSTLAMNLTVDLQSRGRLPIIIDADTTLGTAGTWAGDRRHQALPPIPAAEEGGNLLHRFASATLDYDDAIIDVPPGDSPQLESASLLSDVLVVPTTGQQVDLDALGSLHLKLTQARRLNPKLKVIVALNRVAPHEIHHDVEEAKRELRRFPHFQLAEPVLLRSEDWTRAVNAGKGVVEIDGEASTTMQKLTSEIFAEIQSRPLSIPDRALSLNA